MAVKELVSEFDGTPMQTTCFYESAQRTYRPQNSNMTEVLNDEGHDFLQVDFSAFIETMSGKDVGPNAYGKAGGVVQLAVKALLEFTEAFDHCAALVASCRKHATSLAKPYVLDYEDACNVVDRMLDASPEQARMVQCGQALRKGYVTVLNLKQTIDNHIAQKKDERGGSCLLMELPDDCLSLIAQHTDCTTAIFMMRTCKGLHSCDYLKSRIPHMRIRTVKGQFPHYQAPSYNRSDLAQNNKQPLMRDFIVKKKQVNLWIDFVQPTLRDTPLKKKPRSDGLDNSEQDFSDDEFEEDSESPLQDRPFVPPADPSTQQGYGQRLHKLLKRRQDDWDALEGPVEKSERLTYNKRIPYQRYFLAPLEISTTLVLDETLEPVGSNEFPTGIKHCNRVAKAGGTFQQPVWPHDTHEMPAHCKMHIPLLSTDHSGRLFRVRLTGSGTSRSGQAVNLTTFSEPFEVVSDIGTVKRASKRKTVAEERAYARERELKKRRS